MGNAGIVFCGIRDLSVCLSVCAETEKLPTTNWCNLVQICIIVNS